MIYKEDLLQFIWEKYIFEGKTLQTVCGKELTIKNRGTKNLDQGPDFINARIVLDDTEWAGNVEIHLTTSEWQHHGHANDANYNNVILHVVWKNNTTFFSQSPVFELQHFVDANLLSSYHLLMQNTSIIPCSSIGPISMENYIKDWVIELGLNRLNEKSNELIHQLEKLNGSWDELIWTTLCRNFGHRVNAEGFYLLAKSIPFSLVTKTKNDVFDLEALLMGQAGLLKKNLLDEYPQKLLLEYNRLKKLHKLNEISHPIYFLRMRPANFPTIRLAQLSMLLSQNNRILDLLKDAVNVYQLKKQFAFEISNYWINHYRFETISTPADKKPGNTFIDNLFINTYIPILYAYGRVVGSEFHKQKAIRWLTELQAESNSILIGFGTIGIKPNSAAESQSLLALHKNYCKELKCTECLIGGKILNDSKMNSSKLSPIIVDI
jgi:hypothetical protein